MPPAKAREKYVMFVISRYKFKADEQVIVLWELHWGDDRLFNNKSRSLSEIYSFKVISSMVVPKSLWLFYKNKNGSPTPSLLVHANGAQRTDLMFGEISNQEAQCYKLWQIDLLCPRPVKISSVL